MITITNFSLALTNLLLGASLALAQTIDPADLVRDRLETKLGMNSGLGLEVDERRRLGFRVTDFSPYIGDWYNCLQSTMTTINGEIQVNDINYEEECNGDLLGEVYSVTNQGSQMLAFEILMLDRCSSHDLGGEGEEPCPNDTLPSDTSVGNVLVKRTFKTVGSFGPYGNLPLHFSSDHTYLKDEDGEWVPDLERAKIENMDTLSCKKYDFYLTDGMYIICDLHINEYRTKQVTKNKGCKKNNQCKDWKQNKCNNKGGVWTTECASVNHFPDGNAYEFFASFVLVQNCCVCLKTDVSCNGSALWGECAATCPSSSSSSDDNPTRGPVSADDD